MTDYACGECAAAGVRLFRLPHNAGDPALLCWPCSEVEQGNKYPWQAQGEAPHFCIGDRIPAVPFEDTFWGYTSIPEEGLRWWISLGGRARGRLGPGVERKEGGAVPPARPVNPSTPRGESLTRDPAGSKET